MYRLVFRSHFNRDIKKMRKKHQSDLIKIIQNSIEEYLKSEPYDNSESLTGPYKGKRKYKRKYKRNELRVIFAICEECRELDHTKHNGCNDCDKYADRTLMFFKTGLRENFY